MKTSPSILERLGLEGVRPSGDGRPGSAASKLDYINLMLAEVDEAETCEPDWQPAAIEPQRTPMPTVEGSFHLTDSGIAERFAAQHASAVRYCWPWNRWLVWDGQRWNPDATGAVERLAKQTARSILREAAAEPDKNRCKELAAFGLRSESAMRRTAMLRLAQSESDIPVLPDALDTDPWLLNCSNGTIDLRTGQLRRHRQADLITKLCPVEYQPKAGCPTWLRFLADIFDGNDGLIGFLQRLVGCCLSGDASEQILPILYGVGANGKTTLINALLDLLGEDYSLKAPADLLLTRRGDTHPTALADLHGKRLVACVETGEGRRLAEALVKELSGGDPIRARRMREDYWQFNPTHKVLLATNHRPAIRGTDHAIWRRIRLVPFDVVVPDDRQDKRLRDKLRGELPGLLAWAVAGCLDWQRNGLGEPDEVRMATTEYRASQDTLAAFLAECCVLAADCQAKASDLLETYREWSGDRRVTQHKLADVLIERGFTKERTRNGVFWQGIGLVGHAEREQCE